MHAKVKQQQEEHPVRDLVHVLNNNTKCGLNRVRDCREIQLSVSTVSRHTAVTLKESEGP